MDRDEMKALLDKCNQAKFDIQGQFDKASQMSHALPTGNEPASQQAIGDAARGVNTTGQLYYQALQNQFKYFSELVARMEKAFGITVSADEDAGQAAKKRAGTE